MSLSELELRRERRKMKILGQSDKRMKRILGGQGDDDTEAEQNGTDFSRLVIRETKTADEHADVVAQILPPTRQYIEKEEEPFLAAKITPSLEPPRNPFWAESLPWLISGVFLRCMLETPMTELMGDFPTLWIILGIFAVLARKMSEESGIKEQPTSYFAIALRIGGIPADVITRTGRIWTTVARFANALALFMFTFVITMESILALSLLKTLFLPCYRSTDFEVHRNWLAVTHSLPLSQWYLDETSEWTLDYPPLFAWFEYALSQVAVFFDPKMLVVSELNYSSPATILFQRLSVIIADLVLAYGIWTCHSAVSKINTNVKLTPMLLLILANSGLLIVDHIHFQYNGFLFGVALHSIGCLMQEKYVLSGFWFAVLLNLKHIYLYCAPVYFVYLLRHYCLAKKITWADSLKRLLTLGVTVISVFAVSFGPFIFHGQLSNVLQRLFPFKRGLCHAYWAPNFWALYNGADKVLAVLGQRLGILQSNTTMASMTGGLVQEFSHSVLPSVVPLATFLLAALAMVPVLFKLWSSKPSPVQFLRAIVLCSYGSFLFGWHVHEKAILMVIVPLTILTFLDKREASLHLLLSTSGHVALLPLLFRPEEALLKILIVFTYALAYYRWVASFYEIKSKILSSSEQVLMLGLCGPIIGELLLISNLAVFQRFPFLPLLYFSIYCSICLGYCWIKLYVTFWTSNSNVHIKSKMQ